MAAPDWFCWCWARPEVMDDCFWNILVGCLTGAIVLWIVVDYLCAPQYDPLEVLVQGEEKKLLDAAPAFKGVDLEGGDCTVNTALRDRPELAVLFATLTPAQEMNRHRMMVVWWGLQWILVFLWFWGLLNEYVMGVIWLIIFARIGFTLHDAMHLKTEMPFSYRMCMPLIGWSPFQCTYGDLAHDHRTRHHVHIKAALDSSANDRDQWIARMPLWFSYITLLIHPSNFGVLEILYFYYANPCTWGAWIERFCLNIFVWAQWVLIYFLGGFYMVLFMVCLSQLSSACLYLLFHGIVHSETFYSIINKEKTGRRKTPYLDQITDLLISPGGRVDMWFHDFHHAFPNTATISCRYNLAGDKTKLEEAVADIMDRGLFVDKDGKPVKHLPNQQLGNRTKEDPTSPSASDAPLIKKDLEADTAATAASDPASNVIVSSELKQHNSKHEDPWLRIDDKVYSVGKFLYEHPGGKQALLNYAGANATKRFYEIGHSVDAHRLKDKMLVGMYLKNPMSPKTPKSPKSMSMSTTDRSQETNLANVI